MNKTKVTENAKLIYNRARQILYKYTDKSVQDLSPVKSELNFVDADQSYIISLFL
jgi:hypothetical protein